MLSIQDVLLNNTFTYKILNENGWHSGIGAKGGQKSKTTTLNEQLRTSPLFLVEYQLRVTLKKCQRAI